MYNLYDYSYIAALAEAMAAVNDPDTAAKFKAACDACDGEPAKLMSTGKTDMLI